MVYISIQTTCGMTILAGLMTLYMIFYGGMFGAQIVAADRFLPLAVQLAPPPLHPSF